MHSTPEVVVGLLRLDPVQERLWHGAREIRLRPKTFAVLTYLLRHPGRLISKQELLDAVWPQTHVSDAAIKTCIAEIRSVLGRRGDHVPWIETRPRRGYRVCVDELSAGPPDRPLPRQ